MKKKYPSEYYKNNFNQASQWLKGNAPDYVIKCLQEVTEYFENNILKRKEMKKLKENKKEGDYWFVWVKKEENQIVPGSISPNPDFAEKILRKLQDQYPEIEFGLGNSSIKFSNMVFIKDFDKNDLSCLDCHEFVVLDCETTGSAKNDEVIDLAAVIVRDYEIVAEFQSYIMNTAPITFHAQRIHGLSQKFIDQHGRDAKQVYKEFKDFIGDLGVVGHGVSYDKRMIEQHSSRVGIPVKIDILYDTSKIGKQLLDMPNYKLEDILDRFSLRKGLKSHGALDDVIGTQRFAHKLYKAYKKEI